MSLYAISFKKRCSKRKANRSREQLASIEYTPITNWQKEHDELQTRTGSVLLYMAPADTRQAVAD